MIVCNFHINTETDRKNALFHSPPQLGVGSKEQQQWLRVPRQRSSPPLGVVKEEVAVLFALVRRYRRAVGAAMRRAVDDEVPGAVEARCDFYTPEATNTGPGFNRGSGGGARGCGFKERVQ